MYIKEDAIIIIELKYSVAIESIKKLTIKVKLEPPCIIEVKSSDNATIDTIQVPLTISLILINKRIVKMMETENITAPIDIDVVFKPRVTSVITKSNMEQIQVAIAFILCIFFMA
jgi:molybdopterin-binding protein